MYQIYKGLWLELSHVQVTEQDLSGLALLMLPLDLLSKRCSKKAKLQILGSVLVTSTVHAYG